MFEYPSAVLRRNFTIDEVAEHLRLVLSTDGVLRYKSISFVCHSMGGVVVRAFVLKYQSQVVPKIRFLYFFATPTTGSPYATLAGLISKNSQFRDLYPMRSDNFLGPQQSSWQAAHFGLRSYCAYETVPTQVGIIVERQSATNMCTERLDPIEADHIGIVKPIDSSSTCYRVLKSAFEETAPSSREKPPRAAPLNRIDTPPVKRIIATTTSGMVARIFSRSKLGSPVNEEISATSVQSSPPVEQLIESTVQELFYEWRIAIEVSVDVQTATLRIRNNRLRSDRIRVVPQGAATIADQAPEWMSGFSEPRKPDFYVRNVEIRNALKGSLVVVTVRRPIVFPLVTDNIPETEFDCDFDLIAPGYAVEKRSKDRAQRISQAFVELHALALYKYRGANSPPLEIRRDPDLPDVPLSPGEIEASFDVRCKNESCSQLEARQLEVRRPLAQD